MEFSKIENYINKDLGKLYRKASVNMGFLTLDGKEMLIPIDGQHRYASIKTALTGKSIDDKELKDFNPNHELGKDDVSSSCLICHK